MRDIRITFTHTWDDQNVVEVTAVVSPPMRGMPQTMDDPGTPDDGAEAHIVSVVLNGRRIERIPDARLDELAEAAITACCDQESQRHDDYG